MQFHVLGPVGARAGSGGAVALGGRRQRALLAALLLQEGREIGEDRLADLVWGSDVPTDPRAAVQTCVARLRRALPEPERVERGTAGYRLDLRGAELDLARFREEVQAAAVRRTAGDAAGAAALLRGALARWTGEPLEDLLGLPVADTVLPRLQEERLAALEDRLSDDLACGRHREVVGELAELVAHHPLRERLRELHLLALYRSGRQSEALEAYRAARDTLVEELGVEPGPELSRLHDLVLRQDPGLAPRPPQGRPPGNLPHTLSSFLGREEAVEQVRGVLATARLVTLTGAGGSGKTRLAREVAVREAAAHADGAWLVELAPVATGELVARQVADALGLVLEAGRPELAALIEHCRGRSLLLVLDSCEHLLDPVADLVLALQRAAGGVRVLVTSRQPLACEGEHVWPVPPLETPRGDRELSRVASYPAVQLFVDRARAADPSFALIEDNADVVARVCERLDGLPLALELAAAWAPAVGCTRLLDRLQHSLDLLDRTRRSSDPRHRSLTAALDWSHDLLTADEQQALRRLSVFVSGFPLDGAAAVLDLASPELAADRIAGLRGCSLVVGDTAAGGRLRLLEPVRQYAAARLEERGERVMAQRAHAQWCGILAAQGEPRLRNDPAGGPEVVALLEREHDELRAALTRQLEQGDEQAVALAADLWVFWWSAGHMTEAIGTLRRVVTLPAGGLPQARALTGLAFLECQDFDWAAAHDHARAALDAFAALPPATRETAHYAYALFVQAEVLTHEGDLEDARRAVDDGLAIVAATGDGWGYAFGAWVRANLAHVEGDLDEAHRGHTEMLAAMRAAGLPVAMVAALHSLGVLEMERGRWGAARAHLEEALELRRATGADRLGRYHGSTTSELRDLAQVALELGDAPAALRWASEGLEAAAASYDASSAQACRAVLEQVSGG